MIMEGIENEVDIKRKVITENTVITFLLIFIQSFKCQFSGMIYRSPLAFTKDTISVVVVPLGLITFNDNSRP